MNITFGKLEVIIYTSPWRMDVVDTASSPQRIILSESSQDNHRLVGFFVFFLLVKLTYKELYDISMQISLQN